MDGYSCVCKGVYVCVCTHVGINTWQRGVLGISCMTLHYYFEADSLAELRTHILNQGCQHVEPGKVSVSVCLSK